MKLFIAIMSCEVDAKNGRNQTQLETWLSDAENYRFIVGYPKESEILEKCLYVPFSDGYDGLALKVKSACNFALQMEYDCLFKCDVDTYVRPEKIDQCFISNPALGFGIVKVSDYIGFVLTGETYCSGGAGYLLGRKAMEIIARAEVDDTLEDRWVGRVLAREGITPLHSRSFMPWRVPITKSNDVFSVHLSKPGHVYDKQWMYDVHKEWEESQ